eukprot:CAMPEP_0177779618 /NCGR_PEP_ID=MMETSP0491_2-20121128/16700_1 /TAXON_ID=63592 /ORGANISM="Tetraselmis chuii, Strain PLY429" /LENGTH=268 /DNA_ID=CAMNT_0019299203 /DNA_START=49 /DNA_END=852 /DNA_ORIENTATION=+
MAGELLGNPLSELCRRAQKRGQCDRSGAATGFPVPFAATVATSTGTADGAPAIRSLGIQAIDEHGFVFVVRGALGGGASHAGVKTVSLCHLAGNYPGAGFEEQWRAEGAVEQLSLDQLDAIKAADTSLVAQFLACTEFEKAHEGRKPDASGRTLIKSRSSDEYKQIDTDVSIAQQRLADGKVSEDEMRSAGLAAFRVVPTRVELLEGGPAWPQGPARYQWTRKTPADPWTRPSRLLPYSVPQQSRSLASRLLYLCDAQVAALALAFFL